MLVEQPSNQVEAVKHRFFESWAGQGVAWFRIKGYGLHVKRSKGHEPFFSERYGYTKALYLLGLRFELLRPVWRTDKATGEQP